MLSDKRPSDLTMVDACSGLGGASEWMYRRGWKVYRYDNDPRFEQGNGQKGLKKIGPVPETQTRDVLSLTKGDFPEHVDFFWSSPPCRAFSIAACSRHWHSYDNGGGPKSELAQLSLDLVAHLEKLIKEVKPRYHLMENPRGMMRKKVRYPDYSFPQACFGTVGQKYTDFWGVLPEAFDVYRVWKWEPAPRGSKSGTQGIPKGPQRALIPFALSMTLGISIEAALRVNDKEKDGWWIDYVGKPKKRSYHYL